ncbi:MAG: hypothetical protein WCT77_06835, partial [Bacteroidota bacterium]
MKNNFTFNSKFQILRIFLIFLVFTLSISGAKLFAQPANDNVANAVVISTMPYTGFGSNVGATGESGEPGSYCSGGVETVWWKYIPSTAGNVNIDICGSGYDSNIVLFYDAAGNGQFANFVYVTCNDDWCGLQSGLGSVAVVALRKYYIRIAGWAGNIGSIQLNLSGGPAPFFPPSISSISPPNLSGFYACSAIPSSSFSVNVYRGPEAANDTYLNYSIAPASSPSTPVYTARDAGNTTNNIYLPGQASIGTTTVPIPNATGLRTQEDVINCDPPNGEDPSNPSQPAWFYTGTIAGDYRITASLYKASDASLYETKTANFGVLFSNDLAVTEISSPQKVGFQSYPAGAPVPILVRLQNRGINQIYYARVVAQFYDINMNPVLPNIDQMIDFTSST